MQIATLQFSPILGDVEGNMARADSILKETDMTGVELLVLPEMAFSGISLTFFTSFSASISRKPLCRSLLPICHVNCDK